jgi:hypothetical protein
MADPIALHLILIDQLFILHCEFEQWIIQLIILLKFGSPSMIKAVDDIHKFAVCLGPLACWMLFFYRIDFLTIPISEFQG